MAPQTQQSRRHTWSLHLCYGRKPGSPGFTILEFVLVIILLGIMVVSAAPKLLQTSSFSLEGAAAMIAADIRHAKELAMATHANKSAVFTGATTYTVDGRVVALPAGVTSSTITFTFNPLGEPISGAGGSVVVSKGSKSKTIRVIRYTGKVTVL